MKTTNDWLDAVKRKYHIETDYRLAKTMGIAPNNITHYRAGRRIMDAYTAARIAELLSVDPMKVIAACELERARNDEQRTFWKRLAAAVALGTVTTIGAPPPSAEAGTLHNNNSGVPNSGNSLKSIYIMRQRRGSMDRAAALLTAAGSSIHRAAVWLCGMEQNRLT